MAFGTERDAVLQQLLMAVRSPEDPPSDDSLLEGENTETVTSEGFVATEAKLLVGRYRVGRKLGAGGMGEVFEGYDPQLERPVAIKFPLFDPASPKYAMRVKRFIREAQTAAIVRHGNVCPIYDAGESESRPFVVMALVKGESLAKRLSRDPGPVNPEEAIRIVLQVADGLAAVHQHGMVHRDIKPGNILLDSTTGDALLTDFGLARLTDDDERLTVEGTIAGTPAYMAPEQATGEDFRLGPATDVYGLGVVFYEMLTGRVPFPGNTMSVLQKVINEPPPAPSSLQPAIDPVLEAIVLKTLAKQPNQRYETAGLFADALRSWPDSGRTITSELLRPVGRKKRYLIPFATAASIIIVALGISAWAGGLFNRDNVVDSVARTDPPRFTQLDGVLNVTVSSDKAKGPVTKRLTPVDDAQALPMRDGELIHLHVTLNQPAYIYLLWIDAKGQVLPVYPWDFERSDREWDAPLVVESGKAQSEIHVPADQLKGLPVTPPGGLETAILLARHRPLGKANLLKDLVGQMPESPMLHPTEVVWLGSSPQFSEARLERDTRGLKAGQVYDIDAPVFDLLNKRLKPHFDLMKAIRFAHVSEKKGDQ